MKISLTGHRPERLYGYDLYNKQWRIVIENLKRICKENNCHDAYSGMAEGSDMAFAIAVIELKKEGYDIKLHCILPCKNYQSKSKYYKYIKDNADEWKELSDNFYKGCDNVRDQYLVDSCDKLIAVFDGIKKGGVWSTICKAEKKNIPIIYCDIV